jgi:6-pyruvoyltetrahydropterin/6-carboxytetrahydropterin synthase
MKMKLWIRQEFDAAHNLKGTFPPGHQCCRVHGHRYEATITLAVEDDGEDVMVDYHDMHAGLAHELKRFDHYDLNEVMDKPPTCENVARLLWSRLSIRWPELDTVEIQEQSSTGCVLTK